MWRSTSVRPVRAVMEAPVWMGRMASAASALPAPCPHSASPRVIPVPKNLAVTVFAMMLPEGEASPQPLNPCCLPAHGHSLTAFPSRFRCVCEPGWSGPRCSQSLARDACESQPCRSGGTCTSDGMGFHCTCPPGVQGVCPHVPTPGSPSPLPPAHFLSAPLSLLYICLFFPSPPPRPCPRSQEFWRWVARWGHWREMGTRNLSKLSHSACPPQAVSVSCRPLVPQIPVSMGATASLPLASCLSAPAPLAGKVHHLLLPPPPPLHLLCTPLHTGWCWGPRGKRTLGSVF